MEPWNQLKLEEHSESTDLGQGNGVTEAMRTTSKI